MKGIFYSVTKGLNKSGFLGQLHFRFINYQQKNYPAF